MTLLLPGISLEFLLDSNLMVLEINTFILVVHSATAVVLKHFTSEPP
jgi:hypothetical protein